MTAPKITILFYSTYGTNHAIAEAAAEAARAAGAEVRLRRAAETAPRAVVESQEAWAAQLEKMKDIPEVQVDDMVWADGYFLSVPTRYGAAPSQVQAFIDTLGGAWSEGKLANKTFTATTSAGNTHGGQETTLMALNRMAIHWGAIIVAPGYADPIKFEDGGNPYGYSAIGGKFDETGAKSVAFQARRLVEMTRRLVAG
ncbi:flavodoxin family protein [Profundibacterium mesophilum]|uniref:Trp repressor binding protein WrbA n=1 Tax=Profundibacterium mesophilum KAUST100406-0324 TaxID=1037889 RepID=A0A921TCE3_9RHOB|nr:flavodoxin family protein [Profundibacterium mesophilum]KAF0675031.1 putative Trp repressor binding protein WrbA [Profundibacterium mesophilum KAUST100406-0324]